MHTYMDSNFYKGGIAKQSNGEELCFSINSAGGIAYSCKGKLVHYFMPYTKQIPDQRSKCEHMRILS